MKLVQSLKIIYLNLKQVTKKLDINIVSAGFDPISKLK